MSDKTIFYVAVTLVLASTVTSSRQAIAKSSDVLSQQISKLGFQNLSPMSPDASPGILYLEQKDGSGNRVKSVLCDDLFPGSKPVSSVVIPSISSNSEISNKASLSLLPGVFKSKASADTNLSATGLTKATLSFKGPSISRLQSLVTSDGSVRTISKACADGIAPFFDRDGNANGDIYLIVRTLQVSGVTYDITVKSGKSAGLKAALTNLIGLDFGYSKTSETTAKLSFEASPNAPLVVGINAVKIKKIKTLSMVANVVNANVAGDPVAVESKPTTFRLIK